MCAVSVIYDMFAGMPDAWYTPQRLELFRSMEADAIQFDREAAQPDCVDTEKAKLLLRIEELEKQIKERMK
jgi:hypothetical protein